MSHPTEISGAQWLDWMDQELAQAPSSDGEKAAFEMLLVGEDAAATERAEELCLCLAVRFVHEITFEGATSSFAGLADRGVREAATMDAAAAKMILLSFGDSLELPAHLEAWIESLPPAPHVRALVALFAPEHEATPEAVEISERLRDVAAKAGMDFLSNTRENLRYHTDGITVKE